MLSQEIDVRFYHIPWLAKLSPIAEKQEKRCIVYSIYSFCLICDVR